MPPATAGNGADAAAVAGDAGFGSAAGGVGRSGTRPVALVSPLLKVPLGKDEALGPPILGEARADAAGAAVAEDRAQLFLLSRFPGNGEA